MLPVCTNHCVLVQRETGVWVKSCPLERVIEVLTAKTSKWDIGNRVVDIDLIGWIKIRPSSKWALNPIWCVLIRGGEIWTQAQRGDHVKTWGTNWKIEMDVCTLLYIKWIIKKDLLHNTGNSNQCFAIIYKKKNLKKNIYIKLHHKAGSDADHWGTEMNHGNKRHWCFPVWK